MIVGGVFGDNVVIRSKTEFEFRNPALIRSRVVLAHGNVQD